MYWISKTLHTAGRFRRQALIFLAVLGPGIITMVADNDAGGISTYAVTGSRFGFSLLWLFIILVPVAFFIQEMTVRLGAVTKRGHAEIIFEGFGPLWGWFSVFDLAVVNWLTLITEYIGMIEAMNIFGVPGWITYLAVTVILLGIVLTGRYWTFEKITLVFVVFNFVYIPAALWAMKVPGGPGWAEVGRGFIPRFEGGLTADFLFVLLANIGTTITPWQIFFQQSSVVDKGLDIHDVKFGRLDTLAGSVFTGVVAAFIIITTGAAFHFHHPPIQIQDAKQTAEALVPLLPAGRGELARRLFAIGLFDAGFLGALCISLSTSWALGEIFGWAHSLNKSVRDAPWFYIAYLAMLLTAGGVVLIPGAPLVTITMYVQIVAITLLPACLVFLILILNDEGFMGEHVNTRGQNVANWSIALTIIAISSVFALSILFPGLFGMAR